MNLAICILISSIGLLQAQPGKPGGPKVALKQAGPGQSHMDVQTAHDGPVIIGDGSVNIDLGTDAVVDLQNTNPKSYVSPSFKGLMSHTHAHWIQTSKTSCTTSEGVTQAPNAYPQHALQVMNSAQRAGGVSGGVMKMGKLTTVPLSDCDTIEVFLDRYDSGSKKWGPRDTAGAPMKLTIKMAYVPAEAFLGHPVVSDISSQQAWIITPSVPLPAGTTAQKFHTNPAEKHRIQKVVVSGSQSVTIGLSNGCSKMQITTGNSKWDAQLTASRCEIDMQQAPPIDTKKMTMMK